MTPPPAAPRSVRPLRLVPVAIVALAAFAASAPADQKAAFTIAPGALVISDEEKAIVADPIAGAEQAVVLVEETEQDDTGVLDRTTFHFRAKILGNESRDLANVEIPLRSERGYLKEWWGRTLLPDGKVQELLQGELKEQVVGSAGRRSVRALKGILPGVGPGSVIDFGWTVWDTSERDLRSVPMQGRWPIRLFRYHWLPTTKHGTAWVITRREGLRVDAGKVGLTMVVEGHDLPPVVEEPFMPPGDEVHATLWMYTTHVFSTGSGDFWNVVAQGVEDRLKTFSSFTWPIGKALAAMQIPDGADLTTKLRKAYDWLTLHVKDADLLSLEEDAKRGEREEMKGRTAGEVIASGAGTNEELADLYVTFARKLGAEANLILAADRSDHFWHPQLLTLHQFDATLVAVKGPGEPDEKITYALPGSGLPFGEVPWWFTGIGGLLISRKGGRTTTIWDAPAKSNVSDTRVDLAYTGGGDLSIRWLRSGTGQQGYLERSALRRLHAEDRGKVLEDLCGAGAGLEISVAEMPGLESLDARSPLRCEGTRSGAGPQEEMQEFRFGFQGPWIRSVPELTAAARVQPVVFEYPGVDLATIEVGIPPGFRTAEAPPPVKVEGPFGSYSLVIERKPDGYHVLRDFSLLPLSVKKEDYPVLRRYLEEVRRADRTPLVFTKAAPPS